MRLCPTQGGAGGTSGRWQVEETVDMTSQEQGPLYKCMVGTRKEEGSHLDLGPSWDKAG